MNSSPWVCNYFKTIEGKNMTKYQATWGQATKVEREKNQKLIDYGARNGERIGNEERKRRSVE
jgi:hypothetical protein